MAVSFAAVARRVRNYFERERVEGAFAVTGGRLAALPEGGALAPTSSEDSPEGSRRSVATDAQAVVAVLPDAPFIAIQGGGVYPAGELPEGEISGVVWGLYPPADFLALCEEISAYDEQHPRGAYQKEAFAGYSYDRGAAEGGWEEAFAARLAPYRRMFTEVNP